MDKEKKKKRKKKLSAPRLGSLPFLLIWIGGHILTWIVLYGVSEMRFFWNWSDMATIVLFGVIMGVGLSLLQKGLIRFTFHAPLRWWLRVTVVGWVLGWVALFYSVEFLEAINLDENLGLMLLPLFVIPALLQWWILRRNARDAWLWIAAGAVSALAFGVLYGEINYATAGQFALGATAQGAVTGLSLLWLYGQTRSRKVKV